MRSRSRVILPAGPSHPDAGATLVAEAFRRSSARAVVASLLLDELPVLLRTMTATPIQALATVPVAHVLEPRTLVDGLALRLGIKTSMFGPADVRPWVADFAPVVVLTEALPGVSGVRGWRVQGLAALSWKERSPRRRRAVAH